jgi:hypothetical protein
VRWGRRLVSCIAAWALVVQTIASGLAAGQAAIATSAPDALGFELCLHNADENPALPSAPSDRVPDHCKFCIAGEQPFLAVPPPDPHILVTARVASGCAPAPAARLPASGSYLSARPRGPPLRA